MTILLALWGAIGPLVGVLIGAWLTRSWQREQWVLDSKKAEYRELISTLSESYHRIMELVPMVGPVNEADERVLGPVWVAGMMVIEDRIFIDHEVRKEKIRESWLRFADWDVKKLNDQWKELHDALVRMAHQDLGIENEPKKNKQP